MRARLRSVAGVVAGLTLVFAGMPIQADDKPKSRPVKEIKEVVAGTYSRIGIVAHIDEDGMTVVELRDEEEPREYHIVPVDRLRKGEVLDNVSGDTAYRWQDVKKGDTVDVWMMKDKAEGNVYCLEISIRRRPGGKLPKSQKPDEDHWYNCHRIFNDLENGEDVTDADIKKAFPPRAAFSGADGKVYPAHPGGLSKDWQAKLDAIRDKAKKDKDLKATPPEKK